MQWFISLVQNPVNVSWVCLSFIILYYVISAFCIDAEKKKKRNHVLRKNKPLDIITSVLWFLYAIVLIWSLIDNCIANQLSLRFLVLYYIFFIFLFAFCYGLLEWHFTDMLYGVKPDNWRAELQYIILSVQTQTTLGYTRVKPARMWTEVIACGQALLGLFFTVIFIAKAVK